MSAVIVRLVVLMQHKCGERQLFLLKEVREGFLEEVIFILYLQDDQELTG